MELREILREIKKSKIDKKFDNFLSELSGKNYKLNQKFISEVIFFQMFRIRQSMWRYECNIKRYIDYQLSDIFQDLIAHYLRQVLGKKYETMLEFKHKKCRPDLLILKNGRYHSAIEIKTNIGWDRKLIDKGKYLKRLKHIKRTFGIPLSRIFYILETPTNVSTEFASLFFDEELKKVKPRTKNIHKYIFPLFYKNISPYYIDRKIADKTNWDNYKEYSDGEIIKFARKNIITPFNKIISKVKG